MKHFRKIAAVLALAAFLVASPHKAAGQDAAESILKIGVKGGINFTSMSRFELGYISESVSSYTGFNAGVAFSIDMPVQGMTLQPELNYVSKGATHRGPDGKMLLRADFIEVPVNLQVGLDLILLRPYVMVSPYIGYAVLKEPARVPWSDFNRFQYGVGIGGGVDFWRLQLQVKYNWNIGQLLKDNAGDSMISGTGSQESPVRPAHMGNYRGLEVNLVFFF
ncbi:MAG TPA: PorT family protein [Candidatus Coprenecus merdigallinarum]|nr:PorT family protein [Candidatus Coprenecus merdigallinarum]